MKILNLGSLNIDKVYSVPHFVAPGETLTASRLETFAGGKGLNQSVALARAGARVYAAGAIGPDGKFLVDLLRDSGANVDRIQHFVDVPTGHAIIQVVPQGQNCIIISAGANGEITEGYIDDALEGLGPGDLLLLQNEVSCVPYAIRAAKALGLSVAFNPSPIDDALFGYPLDLVDWFILNEIEGKALAGMDSEDCSLILDALLAKFPQSAVVLTLGSEGVLYGKGQERLSHRACKVPVADSTAAGDTFCGFFLASLSKGLTPDQALEKATLAAALAIQKKGAAPSIPTWEEVEIFKIN